MSENIDSDLKKLQVLSVENDSNLIVAQLNINSLDEKINHLREICKESPINILCVDEIKIDSSYPDAQSQINDYQFQSFRRDRNKYGGGKIVFTRRLPKFQTKVSEAICVELTISKKKWCILFAYRPSQNNNLKTFFREINLPLSTIVNEYGNTMLIGDLNLNAKSKSNIYYSDLCDTFDLTNLIKANICFKSSKQTSIDVTLTNRPRSFQKYGVITTGLSDYHKMILTFFRSYFSRLPTKTIT